MLLYNAEIKPSEEITILNVIARNTITCGSLQLPVADLTEGDYTGESQKYFKKNLKAVVLEEKSKGINHILFRNDNEEPDRETYAISYRCEDGYTLIGADQRFVASKFAINKEGIDIIGREFPEMYSEHPSILRVFMKNEEGNYCIAQFIPKNEEIKCVISYYKKNSEYAEKVLNKRAFTGFIRAFGSTGFINKVKVPPKTRIFISPNIVEKVSAEKFLARYFPGGYIPTEHRHYEVWKYNPDALTSVIDSILQDEEHPTYQVYFLGYGFEKSKVLRDITDTGFAHRREARNAARNRRKSK